MDGLTGLSRGRRVAVALGLLVVLVTAVAVASTGDAPLAGGTGRRPSDRLVDVVVSLLLVLLALGAPVLAVLLLFRRHAQARLEQLGVSRRRGPLGTIAVLAAVGVLVAVSLKIASDRRDDEAVRIPSVPEAPAPDPGADGAAEGPYRPRFAAGPVALVLGVSAAAALAAALAARARRRASGDDAGTLAAALADVLDETLDDLRAEPDARRAVVAAYARLERALAAYGLPRRPSEAPEEYLRRLLADLEVGRRHAARLTDLFARAKFSAHEIGPETKEEAIDALERVRADLRAAEARAEAERAAAVAVARERAGAA